MFRPASQSVLRRSVASAAPRTAFRAPRQVRTLATSAAPKKSIFKHALLRWGAAGALVYYYSTSSVFAEEPKFVEKLPPPATIEDERPPSLLDEVIKSSKRSTAAVEEENAPSEEAKDAVEHSLGGQLDAEDLAEEAGQEGAFNPETGEINWDCPCLGGMAHGPCGPQFRVAFSCFVYSTADPKGVDCVDKFKDMQTCFQAHPEIYGGELDDDEEEDTAPLEVLDPEDSTTRSPATSSHAATSTHVDAANAKPDTEPVDAGKPEEKAEATGKGIEAEQTKV